MIENERNRYKTKTTGASLRLHRWFSYQLKNITDWVQWKQSTRKDKLCYSELYAKTKKNRVWCFFVFFRIFKRPTFQITSWRNKKAPAKSCGNSKSISETFQLRWCKDLSHGRLIIRVECSFVTTFGSHLQLFDIYFFYLLHMSHQNYLVYKLTSKTP